MTPMKKLTSLVFAGFIIVGLSSPGSAVPIGSDNEGMDYIFKGRRLKWLSAGAYVVETKRGITLGGTTVETTLSTRQQLGYIGVNIAPWMTLYGLGGGSEAKLGGGAYSSSDSVYGIGARFNVLNHEIMEPVMMEDRWRVSLGVQYSVNQTDVGPVTWDWDELSVALTFGIVNDTLGNKYFAPESILLYAGPIYSVLDSDRFAEKEDLGVVVGAEIFITDSLSLDLEVQSFDETSMAGGINIHF